jgi:hypothetical protein
VGRRVLAWVVAAVVTAGLVTGGVLVARGGGDPSPAVLPALDLGAAGQATADANSAAGATEPAPAPGATEPAKRSGDRTDQPRLWPPVTYRLGGPLPSLPDRARAWKVCDSVDPARVATLAAALGLHGQPTQERSGWTVRDGRRALVVHKLAGVPWSFSNLPGSGFVARPVTPASPFRPPTFPSRAEAERVARDLATRAGLDLNGATVRVTDSLTTRTVTFAPAVGGVPTSGFSWTVAVGAKGVVQHASGYLATPEPADTYPLIGVEEGFERLKRSAPLGLILRPGVAPAVELDPCQAGDKLPCRERLRPRAAPVTGTRLGLRLAPAMDRGADKPDVAYLLPAYLFDLKGGWTDTRAIIAVPGRYLTRP